MSETRSVTSFRLFAAVFLAIMIVATIQGADGKGARGGGFRSSGSFRSRGVGSRGLGSGWGGGGGRSSIGTRWWILAAVGSSHRGRHYGNSGSGSYSDGSTNSTAEYGDEGANTGAGIFGTLYVLSYLIYALVKCFIKTGKYDQTEYVVIYFLSFLCLISFTTIAYYIPVTNSDGTEGEAWDDWFDSNSTFVQTGDSPLNYFDSIFSITGMVFGTLLVLRDKSFGTKAAPFPLNLMTRISIVGVVIVLVTSACIGFSSSWLVPMILLSFATVALTLLRFLGLLHSHRARLPGATIGRKKRVLYWHDGTEWAAGLFSIIFHVLMACSYEEGSVLQVNFGAISYAVLALTFDTFFLLQLYFGICYRREGRYLPTAEPG